MAGAAAGKVSKGWSWIIWRQDGSQRAGKVQHERFFALPGQVRVAVGAESKNRKKVRGERGD
jgi:hypothetical protein